MARTFPLSIAWWQGTRSRSPSHRHQLRMMPVASQACSRLIEADARDAFIDQPMYGMFRK